MVWMQRHSRLRIRATHLISSQRVRVRATCALNLDFAPVGEPVA
jgi:hypothetical protein